MGLGTTESSALPDGSQTSKLSGSETYKTPTPRKPPPEPAQNARTRTHVIASFWAVVLLLGLPMWWWTTSIHRSHLPLQEMLDWADGKMCKPTFPLNIVINAPDAQKLEAEHLLTATQHALDDLNEFPSHNLRLTLGKNLEDSIYTSVGAADLTDERVGARSKTEPPALTVHLNQVEESKPSRLELRPHSTILDVFHGPSQLLPSSQASSTLATTIARKLQELFSEEQASIAYVLMSKGQSGTVQLSPELVSKLAQRATRSFNYASRYHITISLFTASHAPSSWDIENAISEHLDPLLRSFSISNFTVNTQIQLYSTFSPSVQAPVFDELNKIWTLRNDDLSAFINAAEWPLGPSIGDGPTLNFIIYVPDQKTSPLFVKDGLATSWLIPQWGGVTILNPKTSSTPTTLSKEDIRPAMLTFSRQLISLLGAPENPPSLPLQLQSLARAQAASLILSASSTMGSLARLTSSLPGIPIPENVAIAVDSVLSHLDEGCKNLHEGKFTRALDHARVAEEEAERAFFEKSMVGQVYFPDEHKVAVYLPLLGPIGVPLVMSLVKEAKRLMARKS